ncbi:NAD(P)H-hydrate dehydratase [Ornithinimicrobium sp. Arc0846-15]|nr:NAD(P)H-hydrate dehydratase [Ornithinimicrobium laminariae]
MPNASDVLQQLDRSEAAALWPVPGPEDHKYTRGVVGVVAGCDAFPGAAVLSCTAAVEAGAGMVRYLGPATPTNLALQALPEIVPGSGQVQAWLLGPGIDPRDRSEGGRDQLRSIERALSSDEACVVDAGALDVLSGFRQAPTLLTPHAGELAALLSRWTGKQVSRQDVQADRSGMARRAAQLTGATVLLKGADTLVVTANANEPPRVERGAPAWLATAGSGDVLAGLCGMLAAAGLPMRNVGALAAMVHGEAAHRANPGGPVRALAVAHAIPGAVAALLSA